MTNRTIAICLFAGVLSGCSSANVTKNPGPGDNGIRYWRPKPYLLVTPADATGRMVKLELQYLPDYNEEYSIHPKGRKPPAVALKDGWNLVAVGGPAPPPDKPEAAAPPPPAADGMKLPEYVLAAGNIPIGFYEAVFDMSGQSKYLKGWRYIGWSVWGGGNPNGADAATIAAAGAAAKGKAGCAPGEPPATPPGTPTGSAIPGALYGIVFFNGAMTFRQIDEIAGNMTCPQYARTTPEPVAPQKGVTTGTPGAPTPPATQGRPADNKDGIPTGVPEVPKPNGESSSRLEAPSPLSEDTGVTQTSAKITIPPPRIWKSADAPAALIPSPTSGIPIQ
jgi:hypothetical protein